MKYIAFMRDTSRIGMTCHFKVIPIRLFQRKQDLIISVTLFSFNHQYQVLIFFLKNSSHIFAADGSRLEQLNIKLMIMVSGRIGKEFLGYYLQALADVVMPRSCIVCGRRLELKERSICIYCYSDIPFTRFELRSRNPMADRLNELIEKGRNEGGSCPEPYSFALALFHFSHNANYRKIPYNLKYKGNIRVGKYFGKLLGDRIRNCVYLDGVDAVIPVPLHWLRKISRGYNQAEVIAEEIASSIGAVLRTDILKRSRRTKTQTKLDVSGKLKNVSGAFSVRDGVRTDGVSHILLVDDVFTTGATVYSCFEALRRIFPSSVRISVSCLSFVG